MKNMMMFVLVVMMTGIGWTQEVQQASQPAQELRPCLLEVKGMYCSGCVESVKSALGNLDGVSEINVDLKSGQANFKYDPGKVTVEETIKAVEAVGFKATPK